MDQFENAQRQRQPTSTIGLAVRDGPLGGDDDIGHVLRIRGCASPRNLSQAGSKQSPWPDSAWQKSARKPSTDTGSGAGSRRPSSHEPLKIAPLGGANSFRGFSSAISLSSASTFRHRRFWTMVAHGHGGIWSAADPARSLGIGESTVRRYLDLFAGLLMVRQLHPWHENLSKRQVKAPKVYVRDSGLLHALLGVRTEHELLAHPKSGASWEGYALEEIIKTVEPDEAYFWATHQVPSSICSSSRAVIVLAWKSSGWTHRRSHARCASRSRI
jgi:hypothetical protein